MTLLLQTPFTMACAGATSSGKTSFVKRLLSHLYQMTTQEPKSILYCYGTFQPAYAEMERDHSQITFQEGLPNKVDLETLSETGSSMVILDDLMDEVNNSKEMQKLFTQYSHHKKISVIFVSQNLYFGGKYGKTINLNSHYLVLFKNPNLSQIRILGQQLLPGRSKVLTEAYEDATAERYGYLLVDLHPANDRDLMFRTHIFPGEDAVVYQPKN
jgi:GTPase SAR1 family protein